ncbi:hypothetical protein LEP1GSC060_3087 [Leptospira weilii serovar Ranarum str. ICFT]|uniref:Uncharacterized protein n=1 Tax=Leptospira weilii serovar Ranarum str. ICFT TaxID=1218598 RepID=N1WK59_9LEPT|nr:hypothetical protein LEP1GSC060_3087 [Leptospira weilii serovar Ranarum str. ICFT]
MGESLGESGLEKAGPCFQLQSLSHLLNRIHVNLWNSFPQKETPIFRSGQPFSPTVKRVSEE